MYIFHGFDCSTDLNIDMSLEKAGEKGVVWNNVSVREVLSPDYLFAINYMSTPVGRISIFIYNRGIAKAARIMF
jgi:hypothetical protein